MIAVKSRNLRTQYKESVGQELVVLCTRELSVLCLELSESFMFEFPDIAVRTESALNLEAVRKITAQGNYCDILVSTDAHMIQNSLMPDQVKFNISFASLIKDVNNTPVKLVCSVCIPVKAPDRASARLWIKYLFSENGQAILKKNGYTSISPLIIHGNKPDFIPK
jgi:ABC-type molybdate transport system substrate-binding protein